MIKLPGGYAITADEHQSTLEEAAALFRRMHDETTNLVFPGEEGTVK